MAREFLKEFIATCEEVLAYLEKIKESSPENYSPEDEVLSEILKTALASYREIKGRNRT